jgi:hypothetical protein
MQNAVNSLQTGNPAYMAVQTAANTAGAGMGSSPTVHGAELGPIPVKPSATSTPGAGVGNSIASAFVVHVVSSGS